ncbi:MAG: hypothetical protein HY308_19000 [Gammaproteobacteria bacterium]|nr:hypothetical protein [Gammaproteobacteria bacterium]
MTSRLDAATAQALVEWIERYTRTGGTAHARGYQGQTYLYEANGQRLIVKVALGTGVRGWFSRWTLRREHNAYQRLDGFAGSPPCHGLLGGRYLVLDYIDGVPLRDAPIADRQLFFDTLLEYIKELHQRGVAHADLKRKDNLLVIDGRRPCLIDYGAAIVQKRGFTPFNRFFYDLARQFDFNAWVKLKHRYIEQAPAADLAYYKLTRIEWLARRIKRAYLAIKPR